MTQELSTKYGSQDAMNMMLGFGGPRSQGYPIIKADNGSEGRPSSGEFITSEKNAAGEWENKMYGKVLKGVIIMALVRLEKKIDNGKTTVWSTEDFNQQDPRPFKMYGDGGLVMGEYTYEQVKRANSRTEMVNGKSVQKNDFNYIVNLYVLLDSGDIVKIRCSGASRSNWFDYSSGLSKLKRMPYNLQTTFSIEQEPKNFKYSVAFSMGELNDEVTQAKVNETAMKLLGEYEQRKTAVPEFSQPEQAEDLPTIQVEPETPESEKGDLDKVPW